MSTTYVALLRGVNVGGRTTVRMDELRRVFEELGHEAVSTYIQSGNVVFSSSGRVTAAALERAIGESVGLDTAVALRTAAALERIVDSNPFPGADPATLHVGFLTERPAASAVARLDTQRHAPEEVVVRGTEAYFRLPHGMGRAKLPGHVADRLRVPMTVRNWRTVTKLVESTAR